MDGDVRGFLAAGVAVWSTGMFGVSLGEVLLAVVVFFLFLFARRLFSRFIIRTVKTVTARTKTTIDDEILSAIEEPLRFVFVVVGVYAAGQVAPFPEVVNDFLERLVRSLIAFTIFWTLYRCVEPLSFPARQADRSVRHGGPAREPARLLRQARQVRHRLSRRRRHSRGMGLQRRRCPRRSRPGRHGGGLRRPELISNLFAGIAIFLDHMFEKGDWIRTPDVEGTVEEIGFRTTKIRRFDLSLVTIPNAKLAGEAVVNFSRMSHRRIYWMIGLEYRTSEHQLKLIVNALSEYVHGNADFETDPAKATTLINVDSFNESSIDIMFYCFTKTAKWGEWMIIKETLAYKVKEIVEQNGAGFAFPSSSLYVEKLPFGPPEPYPGRRAGGPRQRSQLKDRAGNPMDWPLRKRVRTFSHWGAYDVEVAGGEIVAGPSLRGRPRPVANRPVVPRRRQPSEPRRPAHGAPGLARAGTRAPRRRPRRRAVRGGRLGRGARLGRRRTRPRRGYASQRRDLRRLVRLGERRAVSPRPEPASPVPQPVGRLQLFGQQLLDGRRPGCRAPRLRPQFPAHAGWDDGMAGDRRARRAGRHVRRHPAQERAGQRRRHRPAHDPRLAEALRREGRRIRQRQPA